MDAIKLDTATSTEILGVLDNLNHHDGLTIVLITHDPDVARPPASRHPRRRATGARTGGPASRA
jgi:ABC-type lipoprotein export system ATPase subunit